jgi:hypothetical protein
MKLMTLAVPFRLLQQAREALLLVPFVGIAGFCFGLLRSVPRLPAPTAIRMITDARGVAVPIDLPFRGVALTWGFDVPGWYLEDTRAPESLVYAGDAEDRARFSHSILRWIYPQVVANDKLWRAHVLDTARGPYAEAESLLCYDASAFLGAPNGLLPLLRQIGLPAVNMWSANTGFENRNFTAIRVDSQLIDDVTRGQAYIARYRRNLNRLEQDVQVSTLGSRPRGLGMISPRGDGRRIFLYGRQSELSSFDFPRAGVVYAGAGATSLGADAERVLAMDPDVIFLEGAQKATIAPAQSPVEFRQDPRWRGLKAARENRVYSLPSVGDAGLIFTPIVIRWLAEVTHPERMLPSVRQELKDRMLEEFGYSLSEAQINGLLELYENKNSAGYARFAGGATNGSSPEGKR